MSQNNQFKIAPKQNLDLILTFGLDHIRILHFVSSKRECIFCLNKTEENNTLQHQKLNN